MRSTSLAFVAFLLIAARAAGQPVSMDQRRQALVQYKIGVELLAGEDWPGAVRAFSKAIDLDPQMAVAHYGLGKSYMGMKSYRDAVQAYTRCRDIFLAQKGASLTDQLAANQRRREQIDELKELLRQQPPPSQAAGTAALTRQRLEERIAELERLQGGGPSTSEGFLAPAEVSLALGSAYFRNNQVGDAEREYVAAIRAKPSYGEAHNNLAVVYMLTGRLDEAEKEVKLAEKNRFRVNPQFKEDLKEAKKKS